MGQINLWPHDLITFPDLNMFQCQGECPSWAIKSLAETHTVVVRRGLQVQGMVPVGVRGYERAHRLGGFLKVQDAASFEITTPYKLAEEQLWQRLKEKRLQLPALHALDQISQDLRAYQWGIGGSSGYELTTGYPTVKPSSDLDLILTNCSKMTSREAKGLIQKINSHGVHADIQIVQGQDGFSLEEYVNARARSVLIKTATGPILSQDPFDQLGRS